jgi:hypothetical protein
LKKPLYFQDLTAKLLSSHRYAHHIAPLANALVGLHELLQVLKETRKWRIKLAQSLFGLRRWLNEAVEPLREVRQRRKETDWG